MSKEEKKSFSQTQKLPSTSALLQNESKIRQLKDSLASAIKQQKPSSVDKSSPNRLTPRVA